MTTPPTRAGNSPESLIKILKHSSSALYFVEEVLYMQYAGCCSLGPCRSHHASLWCLCFCSAGHLLTENTVHPAAFQPRTVSHSVTQITVRLLLV